MADKYYTSTFLPIKKNLQTKELSWAVPGLLQDAYAAYTAPSRALQGQIDVNSPQGLLEANNFALNIVGGSSLPKLGTKMQPGSLGITAWHGSPFKFDKFDLSKVGTGAGNEYYGRGVYFTESPELAKSYAMPDSLENMFADKVAKDLKSAFNDGGIKKVNDYIKKNNLQDSASDIKKYFDSSVYKVDIPDKLLPKMLDFEKPLYKQSDEVKKLAFDYYPALKNRLEFVGGEGPFALSGSDLFNVMQRYEPKSNQKTTGISSDKISNIMLEKGIPGSKYFDSGDGAQNYVVFDPNTIKILERNGLLLP